MKTKLSQRDRLSLFLMALFVVVAWTAELHWLLSFSSLTSRHDIVGQFWELYGRADSDYYSRGSWFIVGVESFHVVFSTWLYLLLMYGICARKAFRYPLQLVVSSYVCYSTALYLLVNHVSGYSGMHEHTLAHFLLLYLSNMPWLLGNFLLAADASFAITARIRQSHADACTSAG